MLRENSAYYQVQESHKERKQHVAYGIRHFHNHVKRTLYEAAAAIVPHRRGYPSRTILDLGGGRGGDLPKYRSIKAQRVVVIEKDAHGLDEFRNRLLCPDPVVLLHGDMTRPVSAAVVPPESVDIVTCQFALHYAFGDARAYTGFLTNLHRTLRRGGCFIGTIVDGKSMREKLQGTGYATFSLDGETFADVRAPNEAALARYLGAPVDVTFASISDLPRREFLVDFEEFSQDLACLGLEPPQDPALHTGLFSDVEGFAQLQEAEQEYSRLHRFFIFQKTRAASDAEVSKLLRRYGVPAA